jgi:hypothetical protein
MLAEAQRLVLLHAMGVDVYRSRNAALHGVEPSADSELSTEPAASAALVAICARGARDQRIAARLHDILGIASNRVIWLEASVTGLKTPPQAGAYLVFGTPLARALGEKLSTMQQMQTLIAIVEDAVESMRSSQGKRQLWQTLKPLARHLRKAH